MDSSLEQEPRLGADHHEDATNAGGSTGEFDTRATEEVHSAGGKVDECVEVVEAGGGGEKTKED